MELDNPADSRGNRTGTTTSQSFQGEYVARQTAWCFVGIHALIELWFYGRFLLDAQFLKRHLALTRVITPTAIQAVAMSDLVINYWYLLVPAGLILLQVDHRVMCWGARWYGRRWTIRFGTCVSLILMLNFAIWGYVSSQIQTELAISNQLVRPATSTETN